MSEFSILHCKDDGSQNDDQRNELGWCCRPDSNSESQAGKNIEQIFYNQSIHQILKCINH